MMTAPARRHPAPYRPTLDEVLAALRRACAESTTTIGTPEAGTWAGTGTVASLLHIDWTRAHDRLHELARAGRVRQAPGGDSFWKPEGA